MYTVVPKLPSQTFPSVEIYIAGIMQQYLLSCTNFVGVSNLMQMHLDKILQGSSLRRCYGVGVGVLKNGQTSYTC